MKAANFFTLPPSLAAFAPYFNPDVAPWEWLNQIALALAAQPAGPALLTIPAGVHIEGAVWLHPTVKLPATATIIGPAWIGPETEIRAGAFIRGRVIAGARCVLGNSCEFKNCLLMDGVQVPHFGYVGDSILGNGAHLGAGAILSNLRLDNKLIAVRTANVTFDTGLRKFGAILGDKAEVGCNAVLNPGTLLGPRALVMPAIAIGGYVPANTIARLRQTVAFMPRGD